MQGGAKHVVHLLLDGATPFLLLERLVGAIAERGEFAQSICYLCGTPRALPALEARGVRVIGLGAERRTLRRFQPGLVRRLAPLLRETGADLVHCQRHKPTFYGTLAAVAVGGHVGVMSTVHGRNRTRGLGRRLLNRMLMPRIDRFIAVSDAVRGDILASNATCPPSKVVTVHNGIDLPPAPSRDDASRRAARRRFGLSEEAFIVGSVGRLAPVKGHDVLIEAFAQLGDRGAELVLAGAGPLEDDLRERAARLGIAPRVTLLGHCEDVPALLGALDAFALPSHSEGLPLALLEAMAHRLPVVASAVGGVPEVIDDEACGLLVPPSAPGELAAAIGALLGMDGGRRAAMGDAARQRVESGFTTATMAAATIAVYQDVLAARGRRRGAA